MHRCRASLRRKISQVIHYSLLSSTMKAAAIPVLNFYKNFQARTQAISMSLPHRLSMRPAEFSSSNSPVLPHLFDAGENMSSNGG
jgi:hypothetical protein